jgi:transcription elongation factor Elf1
MNDNNYTTTMTCDECGAKAPGVMLHQAGAPVMFICKNCDGKMFERQARQDINDWLDGKEPFSARM